MAVPTTRAEFIENKYSKWYFNIIENAIIRGWNKKTATEYCEEHHYIPKSLGGTDDETVFLTAREHFVCHLLLTKMVSGKEKSKMIFALHRLTSGNNKNYCKSSIFYDQIKKQLSKTCSERSKNWWNSLTKDQKSKMRSGKNNPRYGVRVKGTETALKISKANKGKLSGNKHPLWKIGHKEETKLKVSLSRKGKCLGKDNPNFGKGAAKNKKWFNNGIIEKYFLLNEQPQGWIPGRLKRIK